MILIKLMVGSFMVYCGSLICELNEKYFYLSSSFLQQKQRAKRQLFLMSIMSSLFALKKDEKNCKKQFSLSLSTANVLH